MLARKNDQPNELARKYRASKEAYADGLLKLKEVYTGMIPAEKIPDGEWDKRLTAFRQWIQTRPESITARVALADALTSYGWKARGSDEAYTVTQTGWK